MQQPPSVLSQDDLALVAATKEANARLLKEISKVIVGQIDVVQRLCVALMAQGHVLIIGVPGLAKTLMVKTLAQVLGWEFRRIQFTPDLMPSDIIGTEIIQTDPQTGVRELRFMRGPVFANIILADEINRTPPKTQSALLEAMQEYQVTAAGTTMRLEKPFFVVATQNPIEQEGTYPLPEAQLDRFMFALHIGYPLPHEEERIADVTTTLAEPQVEQVLTREQIVALQAMARRMPVSPHVIKYAVALARQSRPQQSDSPQFINDYVEWGAGPRASQNLILGAKAWAMLQGKPAATAADVRAVARPVLVHRIIPNYNATGEGVTAMNVVDRLLESVKEPMYVQ